MSTWYPTVMVLYILVLACLIIGVVMLYGKFNILANWLNKIADIMRDDEDFDEEWMDYDKWQNSK